MGLVLPQNRVSERGFRSDKRRVEKFSVECLRCGAGHELVRSPGHALEGSQCPRCGYLGWARPDDLSVAVRVAMHERLIQRVVAPGPGTLVRAAL